jgi:hypothetical protein
MPLHSWREHITGFCVVGDAAQVEVFRMCLDVREVAWTCIQEHFESGKK